MRRPAVSYRVVLVEEREGQHASRVVAFGPVVPAAAVARVSEWLIKVLPVLRTAAAWRKVVHSIQTQLGPPPAPKGKPRAD